MYVYQIINHKKCIIMKRYQVTITKVLKDTTTYMEMHISNTKSKFMSLLPSIYVLSFCYDSSPPL
jgi:hypothetical protein